MSRSTRGGPWLRSRWTRLLIAVVAVGAILWAADRIWTDLNYYVERMGVR